MTTKNDSDEASPTVKLTLGAIVFCGVMAWFAAAVTLNGYVLSTLWGWFAAGITGLHMTVPEAIGLLAIIGLLKGIQRDPRSKELRTADVGSDLLRSITIPLVLLAVGYIAHRYMGAA